MLLNLVLARKRESAANERLSRMAFSSRRAERKADECAAAVQENAKSGRSWLMSFEEMMGAYADLIIRDLRN